MRARVRPTLLPPQLSMAEYIDFIEDSISKCDSVKAHRQKQIEEQIRKPFSMLQKEEGQRGEGE